MRALVPALLLAASWLAAPPALAASDYLRWVSYEVPVNENVLLRWPEDRMPLRVYLPPPPAGLFADPKAVQDVVKGGVLDWTDVAAPGVPSFVFVDDPGGADIPFVWAEDPAGGWYVAQCVPDIDPLTRRFGVSNILVTGRWAEGRMATLHQIYTMVLHEMGHALGLLGHSPDPGDVMYPKVAEGRFEGLSERDRATLKALYARPMGARIVGARGKR